MTLDEWSEHQYTFRNADYDGDGKLSGHEAAPILTKLGTDKMNLRKIWTLVDQDSDGYISSKEFCAAMHLAAASSNGRPVPSTLPAQLLVRPDPEAKARAQRAQEEIDRASAGVGDLTIGGAGLGGGLEDAIGSNSVVTAVDESSRLSTRYSSTILKCGRETGVSL